MTKLIAGIVVIGIVALFLWSYHAGTQVEQCIYLIDDFIVCEEGWGVYGDVL